MVSLDRIVAASQEMMACLQEAPEFLPSKFWDDINAKNMKMLREDGFENFKRTVAQNYYNWLIIDKHPQLEFLEKSFPWISRLLPFFLKYDQDVQVRTTERDEAFVLTKDQIGSYAKFVALIWLKMKQCDKLQLAAQVTEPELGNPVHIRFKRPFADSSVNITQDLANSIVECNTMMEHLPDSKDVKIAEIGAGSGRVAHVYSQTQQGKYCIFDIPPALAISQNYLTEIFPDKRLFKFRKFEAFRGIESELEDCDIAFFTSNQMTLFPDGYFDLVTTISTLPEMTDDQVKLFTSQMDRLSAKNIFIKQWLDVWENPHDGTSLRKDDYYFSPEVWKVVKDSTDPINPQFFNRMWERV